MARYKVTLAVPHMDDDNPDISVSIQDGNRLNAMRRALLHLNIALPAHRRLTDQEAWDAYHSLVHYYRKAPYAVHEGGTCGWTLTIEREDTAASIP